MAKRQLGIQLSIHNRKNVRTEAARNDKSASDFIRSVVREELLKMNLPISENPND